MFLKELRLQNIRCFKDISIDFTRDDGELRKWTILLGENGSGKSTLLRSAALVTAGSNALASLLGEPRYWVRSGATRGSIRATLQIATGETREVSLEIRRTDSESDVIARSKESLEPLEAALAHTERNYFVAGYGASRRLATNASFGRKGSRFRHERARSVATLFDADAPLNPLESWAMSIDYRHKDGMKTVRSVLSSFLPGLSFYKIDKKAESLLFKTPDGIVPLKYLSDGYQNVAAWIGDLLFVIGDTFDDYKEPLKTRGLLIIDELDLHLHPKWQRSLHSFLAEQLPNLQLLVTTHSPVTAQQADEHQIHYLTRKGKTIRLTRFEPDPRRLRINQLLMTEAFGVSTDESLEIETTKAKYRRLRDKKRKTAKDKKELVSLSKELKKIPLGGQEGIELSSKQVALLKSIQSQLSKKQ